MRMPLRREILPNKHKCMNVINVCNKCSECRLEFAEKLFIVIPRFRWTLARSDCDYTGRTFILGKSTRITRAVFRDGLGQGRRTHDTRAKGGQTSMACERNRIYKKCR